MPAHESNRGEHAVQETHRLITALALCAVACTRGGTHDHVEATVADNAATAAPTAVELADATYRGIFERPLTLVGGRWEGEPFVTGGASRPTVGLVDHFILAGDLDGDGADEAAALLWESSGGPGNRLHLAVMARRNGMIENPATTLVGDRVQIRCGAIEGNRITLDIVRAGAADPACCPTEKAVVSWALGEDGLVPVEDEVTGTLSLADLEGEEWHLLELGWGQPVPEAPAMTMTFQNGRVTGRSACNSYFAGVVAAAPGELRFTGMGATRIACAEERMELERRYLRTLADASRYSFLAGRLALSCATDDGSTVLVYGTPDTLQLSGADVERPAP